MQIIGAQHNTATPSYLMNIIDDYFHDWKMIYETDDEKNEYTADIGTRLRTVESNVRWSTSPTIDGFFRRRWTLRLFPHFTEPNFYWVIILDWTRLFDIICINSGMKYLHDMSQLRVLVSQHTTYRKDFLYKPG